MGGINTVAAAVGVLASEGASSELLLLGLSLSRPLGWSGLLAAGPASAAMVVADGTLAVAVSVSLAVVGCVLVEVRASGVEGASILFGATNCSASRSV